MCQPSFDGRLCLVRRKRRKSLHRPLLAKGGHLDERAGTIGHEGSFQGGDRLDLTGSKRRGTSIAGGDGTVSQQMPRELLQPATKGVGLCEPGGQGGGLVKGENTTRARLRIAFVAKERLNPGRFVGEWDLLCSGQQVGQKVWEILTVRRCMGQAAIVGLLALIARGVPTASAT